MRCNIVRAMNTSMLLILILKINILKCLEAVDGDIFKHSAGEYIRF